MVEVEKIEIGFESSQRINDLEKIFLSSENTSSNSRPSVLE